MQWIYHNNQTLMNTMNIFHKMMKTPFFIFIVFSTLSLLSAKSPSPVRDTDGNILRSYTNYYIMPTTGGMGGGITIAPPGMHEACAGHVYQEPNEFRYGLPLTFIPAKANEGYGPIFESTDLNVRFPGVYECAVWRVEGEKNGQRNISSRGKLGNPGQETISNWFKIEKYEDGYKLVFCPTVCKTCRPACGDIGRMVDKVGDISLVVNNTPLKVKFIKA